MARASNSKTRVVDKSKLPASQSPAVTHTHEIVPGKFNDGDWNLMLDRDGNEEYIAELVDEFIDATMGVIFQKYLDRQLVPFTITQAKDAIVEIIEWYFLARDDGELQISSDLGWTEDEEPESAATDCWAQGSIPRNFVAAPKVIMTEIPEVPDDEVVLEVSPIDIEGISHEPPELPDTVSDTEELPVENIQFMDSEVTSSKAEETNKQLDQIKSSGILKKKTNLDHTEIKKLPDNIMESDEKANIIQGAPTTCSSFTKAILSHPVGTKDVLCDEMGNVIAVPKLDPEKLPSHKINVKYTVVDPSQDIAVVKVDLKKKNVQKSKINVVSENYNKTPRYIIPQRMSIASSQVQERRGSRNSVKLYSSFAAKGTSGNTPMESAISMYDGSHRLSTFEEIEVSQGITIKEGDRVKKGPNRYYRKLDILDNVGKGMKPVSMKITNPGITVADLLDRQTPILRPYGGSSPLPPIVPHPPHQAKRVSLN